MKEMGGRFSGFYTPSLGDPMLVFADELACGEGQYDVEQENAIFSESIGRGQHN